MFAIIVSIDILESFLNFKKKLSNIKNGLGERVAIIWEGNDAN